MGMTFCGCDILLGVSPHELAQCAKWVKLQPFSLQFEHRRTRITHPLPRIAWKGVVKRRALTDVHYQLFRISFFVGFLFPGCSHCPAIGDPGCLEKMETSVCTCPH